MPEVIENEVISQTDTPPINIDDSLDTADEVVTDDVVTDEVVADEVVSDEVVSDEVVTDEPIQSSDAGTDVVEDEKYTFVEFLELDFTKDLQEFFKHYLVETPDGFFQVFQSLTYGEMLISVLLFTLIVLYVMKWIYEVLRY